MELYFLLLYFVFTSVPYYGFDYLMSNPLGFSQDNSLTWSKTKPVTTLTQVNCEMIIQSMGINVAPFDRQSLLKNDSDDMPFL
jgi:hypothetical protein